MFIADVNNVHFLTEPSVISCPNLVQLQPELCVISYLNHVHQGFSYRSEIRTRGLLNLGKKHLDHQNWEELILDLNKLKLAV